MGIGNDDWLGRNDDAELDLFVFRLILDFGKPAVLVVGVLFLVFLVFGLEIGFGVEEDVLAGWDCGDLSQKWLVWGPSHLGNFHAG